MYSNINNIAYIQGTNGIYDGKVADNSVRYGRNALANHMDYLSNYTQPNVEFPDMTNLAQLDADKFEAKMNEYNNCLAQFEENNKKRPPLNFVQQYMSVPQPGMVDTKALMGAAYEEMGKRTAVPVQELTQGLQNAFDDLTSKTGAQFDCSCADLNGDGNIDLAEYGAVILASDALSTDDSHFNAANINGTVTNKGENKSLYYAEKTNYQLANQTYRSLYNYYGLAGAQNEFLQNPNNMAS